MVASAIADGFRTIRIDFGVNPVEKTSFINYYGVRKDAKGSGYEQPLGTEGALLIMELTDIYNRVRASQRFFSRNKIASEVSLRGTNFDSELKRKLFAEKSYREKESLEA